MKRVLLKLSGEALAGEKKTGFDEATCIGVAKQVKQLVDDGGNHLFISRDRRCGNHNSVSCHDVEVFVI